MLDHLWLVERVIDRKWKRAVQWHDLQDLRQAGFFGLMDAASKFDPSRGVKFATYATRRIIGAAIDQLRRERGRYERQQLPMWSPEENSEHADGHALDITAAPARPADTVDVDRVRAFVARRLRSRGYPRRTIAMALVRWVDRQTLRTVGQQFGVTESRASQILRDMDEEVVELIRRAAIDRAA